MRPWKVDESRYCIIITPQCIKLHPLTEVIHKVEIPPLRIFLLDGPRKWVTWNLLETKNWYARLYEFPKGKTIRPSSQEQIDEYSKRLYGI